MPASGTGILLQEESAGCAHASEIEMPKLVPYRYGASMFVMVFLIETSFFFFFTCEVVKVVKLSHSLCFHATIVVESSF